MVLKIETIKNGWLVRYTGYHPYSISSTAVDTTRMEAHSEERAFTFDFDTEIEVAWKELVSFIREELFTYEVKQSLEYLSKKGNET